MYKKIKEALESLFSRNISEKHVAASFAFGTFLALLPTFGIGPIIGLFLITIFKKINKVALLAAFAVWNPLIVVPYYAFSYSFGVYIRNLFFQAELQTTVQKVLATVIDIVSGYFVLSFLISVLVYYIVYIILRIHSARRGKKQKKLKTRTKKR